MAHYPCDHCGLRYSGRSNRAYVAILDGVNRWDHKPRLCPTHLQVLMEFFDQVNGRIDPESQAEYQAQPCLVCAQSVAGHRPHSVFMTAYANGAERTDFFAPVCEDCRPAAEGMLTGAIDGS